MVKDDDSKGGNGRTLDLGMRLLMAKMAITLTAHDCLGMIRGQWQNGKGSEDPLVIELLNVHPVLSLVFVLSKRHVLVLTGVGRVATLGSLRPAALSMSCQSSLQIEPLQYVSMQGARLHLCTCFWWSATNAMGRMTGPASP